MELAIASINEAAGTEERAASRAISAPASKSSALQFKCLYMRISECERLIQQAMLGAHKGTDEHLLSIYETLEAAQYRIAYARELAETKLRA